MLFWSDLLNLHRILRSDGWLTKSNLVIFTSTFSMPLKSVNVCVCVWGGQLHHNSTFYTQENICYENSVSVWGWERRTSPPPPPCHTFTDATYQQIVTDLFILGILIKDIALKMRFKKKDNCHWHVYSLRN